MGEDQQRWVAVNTHANREQFAVDNLARQAFTTYCPLITKRVRHARQARDVLRPLFPGYVFVEVDPNPQQWRPILSTFGVRSLVRSGTQLSFLPTAFIAELKLRVSAGVSSPAAPQYNLGQRVRIAGGAFEGLVVTIVAMDEKDRLVVLMDLLKQTVTVKLDSHAVAAL
jgi:transcriptional antiterminator RfaH